MRQTSAAVLTNTTINLENHPTQENTHDILLDGLTPTEKLCRKIANWTGAPFALIAAICFQMLWIVVGMVTHIDPYPFVFLLTCSNVVQLILIFVIAVAQRQSSTHDEIRAEADHAAISRLLYHQQVQELMLTRISDAMQVDVTDLRHTMENLANE